MKTSLTKGLDKSEAEEIKGLFIQSLRLRERLASIVKEKIDSNNIERISKNSYDNPSWAYIQADAVGYERALKEIISLLES